MFDVVVIGSGVAGLSAAVRAAAAGLSTAVVTKVEVEQTATRWAQGGVAAAMTAPDSPDLHLKDTLVAGAGLCDVDAVRILVNEGPHRIRELMKLGANFDRVGDGPALAREGGHSLARILRAGGDATGAEVERALVAATHKTSVDLYERWFTTELLIEQGRCVGVRAISHAGVTREFRARAVLLATGGIGQMFAVTTNPSISTGDGIAMAFHAGALLSDNEFVQFHPTALDVPEMPRPLLSEALRGDGAILRDTDGVAFMKDVHPLADLAPRDVVARAIAERLRVSGERHLFLDARSIHDFPHRFPTIHAQLARVGLDPFVDLLPVAPAAHYFSGGVSTDLNGATSIPGLFAIGEVACSGVHGANRLASNSLLDGLVFGPRAVEAVARGVTEAEESGVLAPALRADLARGSVTTSSTHESSDHSVALTAIDSDRSAEISDLRSRLQASMTLNAGVLRDEHSLSEVRASIDDLNEVLGTPYSVAARELDGLVTVARCLVDGALAREESRGNHTRTDYPETSDTYRGRFFVANHLSPTFVRLESEEI
ncbi:MAG: L-aspartate oxidase [Acidimicrobiia bacterium]